MNRPNRDPGLNRPTVPSGPDPGTEPLPVYDVDPRTGAPVTDGESLRGGGWSAATQVEPAPVPPASAADTGASAAPPGIPSAQPLQEDVPAPSSGRAAGWQRWSPRRLAVAAVAAGAALFGLGALTGHELTGASGADSVQQAPPGQNGGQQGGTQQLGPQNGVAPGGQNGTSNQDGTTNQGGSQGAT